MANLILNPVCIFITTVSIGAVSFHVAALQIWCLVFNFCQNLQTTFLLSNSNFYSFSPQLPPHTHTCTQTHAEAWLWKLDTVCLTVRHQLVPDTRLQPHWLILQTLLHIVIGCCLLRCSDSDPVNLHMNRNRHIFIGCLRDTWRLLTDALRLRCSQRRIQLSSLQRKTTPFITSFSLSISPHLSLSVFGLICCVVMFLSLSLWRFWSCSKSSGCLGQTKLPPVRLLNSKSWYQIQAGTKYSPRM